jgi:Flp pilus assembly protein TadG
VTSAGGRWAERRAAARDEGATAVEFALVLPVIVVVSFFALYGAMFFFYSAVADHVARSVVRQVSIPTGQSGSAYPDASAATVVTDAKDAAGGLLPDPTTAVATSSPTGSAQPGDLVTITVTYKLPVLASISSVIPGFSSITTITRSASERRQ